MEFSESRAIQTRVRSTIILLLHMRMHTRAYKYLSTIVGTFPESLL